MSWTDDDAEPDESIELEFLTNLSDNAVLQTERRKLNLLLRLQMDDEIIWYCR